MRLPNALLIPIACAILMAARPGWTGTVLVKAPVSPAPTATPALAAPLAARSAALAQPVLPVSLLAAPGLAALPALRPVNAAQAPAAEAAPAFAAGLQEGQALIAAALAKGDTLEAADAASALFDAASRRPAARAVEPGHDLGDITGTDISLKVGDHAFGGAINGAITLGFYDEGKGSLLMLRKYGQFIVAEFKKQEDGYGGVIKSADRSTRVYSKGMVAGAPKPTFNLQIGEELVAVTIVEHEGFEGGHYKNPTYEAVIGGKTVRYRIEVECCLGYSLNMAMLILGAYAH